MARPKSTDFLHNFRFHVVVYGFGASTNAVLQSGGQNPTAGFSTVTAPEVTEDATEYREGHYVYTRKYPGIPTMNTITLSRGVALKDGTFWLWMKSCIEGNEEYRADLDIIHIHRDGKPQTASGASTNVGAGGMPIIAGSGKGAIVYKIHEAIPTRHRPSTDMDGTASEVSIQELELAYEYFEIDDLTEMPNP